MSIEMIRSYHRQQRFIVKMQSRIDRSMEAYIRVYVFGFSPDFGDDERKEISKKTTALIKHCRAETAPPELADITEMVLGSDASRKQWDKLCASRERAMEKLAKELPGYGLIERTQGVGALGFAQIVGEAGDLSNYSSVAKLWKRLGLAPYDGLAMSSWMRETWRPRKLTSEEWVANPFKPERYAIMAQIAQWLWVKQWIGKDKDPDGVGKPNGHYGELYARRRGHTAEKHPDWTPMHSHKDALRYMLKKFIRDLWREWQRAKAPVTEKSKKRLPAAPIRQTTMAVAEKPSLVLSAERRALAAMAKKPFYRLPSALHPDAA